jgi:hypothetical protein
MLEPKDHRDAFGRELKPGDLVIFATSDYYIPGVILNTARCFDLNVKYLRRSKGFTTKRKPGLSLLRIDEKQLNQMIKIPPENILAILELQRKVKEYLKNKKD